MLTAMLMAHNILPGLAALFALAAGVILPCRCTPGGIKPYWKEPMLWILFAGYLFTGLV